MTTIDTATGKEAPAEISSERVKDIFSAIAKKYERFNAVSSFGAYKLWLAGMARQAPIGADDDVLDIAGGTGDVTFTMAREKHPRHIQCTDLVPEMLEVARAHYDEGAAAGVPAGGLKGAREGAPAVPIAALSAAATSSFASYSLIFFPQFHWMPMASRRRMRSSERHLPLRLPR